MTKKISIDILISPNYPVRKWEIDRIQLINDIHKNANSRSLWEKAYNHFYERIESRFLNPIKWILEKQKDIGEGFSIVALQCILIEFLESLYQGLVYTTSKKPKPFEYNESRNLFLDFLQKHKPFSKYFITKKSAAVFYDNIRCGLLHEGRTKESSTINTGRQKGPIIEIKDDKRNLIVYRDKFYDGIITYIDTYKRELLESKDLQIKFIRKIDDLIDIKRILYFAYGKNLSKDILSKRIGKYHTASKAVLKEYRFLYNKKSTKKDVTTAKANIKCQGSEVWGVCYEIDESDLITLKEKYENGYNLIEVEIYHENYERNVKAKTFKSKKIINNVAPSDDYREIILCGAEEWGLPIEYIRNYLLS